MASVISQPCPKHDAPCFLKEFELFLAGFFLFFLFNLGGIVFFKAVFNVGHKGGGGSDSYNLSRVQRSGSNTHTMSKVSNKFTERK